MLKLLEYLTMVCPYPMSLILLSIFVIASVLSRLGRMRKRALPMLPIVALFRKHKKAYLQTFFQSVTMAFSCRGAFTPFSQSP